MNDNLVKILKTLAESYTFEYSYFNSEKKVFDVLFCKCLTMSNLNQIIEASLQDTPLQTKFYAAMTDIFNKSIAAANVSRKFNVVDRLLYILEVRSKSVSSVKTFDEEPNITFNFDEIIKNLQNKILENAEWFMPKSFKYNDITIECDIPSIESDILGSEEFYKNFTANLNNEEDIKLFIGQNFMLELVKCIKSVCIQEDSIDFSTLSFQDRLKVIDQIPITAMHDVIDYNKNYKKIINDCITINDVMLPINGTLFLD